MTENAIELNKRLRAAIKDGDLQRCRALVLAGADVAATDIAGQSLLHIAVDSKEDRTPIVRLLIDAGTPIDLKNQASDATPLHIAANCGHAESVRALLEAGADVNARASLGRTPLHMAALKNRLGQTIAALMEYGANAQAHDDEGQTAVDLSREQGYPPDVEVQIKALEASVDSGFVKRKTGST